MEVYVLSYYDSVDKRDVKVYTSNDVPKKIIKDKYNEIIKGENFTIFSHSANSLCYLHHGKNGDILYEYLISKREVIENEY